MSFKLSDFTASPSQELLDLAKKSDLLDIADHYGLPNIKKTMLKHEIKNILIQFFVDEEIFDSSATSQILVTQTDLQLRELEIKRQVEMEKLRLEHEERLRREKEEREERIRVENAEREERLRREKEVREVPGSYPGRAPNFCYVPGVTRNRFRKPKFSYLESQQKALLKFNKIY